MEQLTNYRTPSRKEFKDGFKYEAFIGYGWIDVEYPNTGFSKLSLKDAIDRKLVRVKTTLPK